MRAAAPAAAPDHRERRHELLLRPRRVRLRRGRLLLLLLLLRLVLRLVRSRLRHEQRERGWIDLREREHLRVKRVGVGAPTRAAVCAAVCVSVSEVSAVCAERRESGRGGRPRDGGGGGGGIHRAKGFAVPFPMAIMNAAAAAAATLGSPPLATPPKVPLSAFMDAPAPLAMPPE